MIVTIGYERLAVERLAEILAGLDAVLVDVRHAPWSRRPEFNERALQQRFGSRYVKAGHFLGGIKHDAGRTTAEGIAWLREQDRSGGPALLLMCVEEAPGNCHRHITICGPHFPEAIHIFENELLTAGELARAERDDDDYEVQGSLSDLLKQFLSAPVLSPARTRRESETADAL